MNEVIYESYQEKDKMLLKVLDENGNISGIEETKKEVHDKKLWHNEVTIFLINEEGKILLQKRSQNVNYNKDKWGLVANHVGVNQTLVDALVQKTKEEIGYVLNPKDIRYLTVQKREEEKENRFTYFYYIKTNIKDEDIHLNNYLAIDKKWFEFSELQEKMLNNSDDVVFKNTPAYINIFGELGKIIKKSNTNNIIKGQEFILINTKDGCSFPGVIHHCPNETKKIAIFIHGSGANFYKLEYFSDMYNESIYNNIDFMVVNNRGSEQSTRIYKNVDGISKAFKGGTIYENFDESIFDVEAAVQYAKDCGYEDICLIGHSLGTVKVQYYCNKIGGINKIVLIAPVDMVSRFRSRVKDRYDELIQKSKECVESGNPYEMVTDEFSAIKVYSTMAVGTNSDIFKLEEDRISNKPLNYTGSVSIIVGTDDHCYKYWNINYVQETLKNQFANAKFSFHIIPNANHMFKGYEKQLSRNIVESIVNMQ